MTTTSVGRRLVVTAAVSLPLLAPVSAAGATQPAPANPYKALIEHREQQTTAADWDRQASAVQQKSYLEQLDRAAAANLAAARTTVALQQQQQQSYLDHLLAAARAADGAASTTDALSVAGQGSDAPDGRGVPLSVAAVLALGGLAVGAGTAVASRRVRLPNHRRVAV
jgi:hypothetical protein